MDLTSALQSLEKAVGQVISASRMDDKTPLGNLVALQEAITRLSGDVSDSMIVVFGDLNGFKALNDRVSPECGDVALRVVGERLDETCKQLKYVGFRMSGDEFVLIGTATTKSDLITALKAHFKTISFMFGGACHDVRISFGVAEQAEKASLPEVLRRAEKACKHAKREGGSGVVLEWSESVAGLPVREFRRRCEECGGHVEIQARPEAWKVGNIDDCPVCGAKYGN